MSDTRSPGREQAERNAAGGLQRPFDAYDGVAGVPAPGGEGQRGTAAMEPPIQVDSPSLADSLPLQNPSAPWRGLRSPSPDS